MDIHANQRDRMIVVGVDGSSSASRALRWAAAEASGTSAVLRIVNAWSVPMTTWPVMAAAYVDPTGLEEGSEAIVGRAAASVRGDLGSGAPVIETRTVRDGAAGGLIAAARDADLLVVGTRGRGGFTSLLLGSVAAACAYQTPVPLAVIGNDAPQPGSGDIVVGLDDSFGARRALRWAAAEASRLEVALRVVHGWEGPMPATAGAPTSDPLADPEVASSARAGLERIVEEELDQLAVRPPIRTLAVPLAASEALITVAANASLLVVGSRGRGGFTGLVLGSVSQQCLHHSTRPLVIIPAASSGD